MNTVEVAASQAAGNLQFPDGKKRRFTGGAAGLPPNPRRALPQVGAPGPLSQESEKV